MTPTAEDRRWFEHEVVSALPDLYGTALRLAKNAADAEDLGYPAEDFDAIPATALESFAGSAIRSQPGWCAPVMSCSTSGPARAPIC